MRQADVERGGNYGTSIWWILLSYDDRTCYSSTLVGCNKGAPHLATRSQIFAYVWRVSSRMKVAALSSSAAVVFNASGTVTHKKKGLLKALEMRSVKNNKIPWLRTWHVNTKSSAASSRYFQFILNSLLEPLFVCDWRLSLISFFSVLLVNSRRGLFQL